MDDRQAMNTTDDSQPQMAITLRAFGLLEYYLGASRIELPCPAGLTFSQLCEIIHARWGAQLPPTLWDASARRFTRQVVVMIAGCDLLPGEDPLLAEDQEVCLLLPFAGGGPQLAPQPPMLGGKKPGPQCWRGRSLAPNPQCWRGNSRRRRNNWTISSFNGKNRYSRHS